VTARPLVPTDLTIWARHEPARSFCAVLAIGDSVETYCKGRWPIGDLVEIHDAPGKEERCGACVDLIGGRQ
jgi:hypothetical protein